MANRHVKVINGRKYYYESIRIGKKVTSKYIGPVEAPIKKKQKKIIMDDTEVEDSLLPEDSYIG